MKKQTQGLLYCYYKESREQQLNTDGSEKKSLNNSQALKDQNEYSLWFPCQEKSAQEENTTADTCISKMFPLPIDKLFSQS